MTNLQMVGQVTAVVALLQEAGLLASGRTAHGRLKIFH